ncbi:hypothetical protein ACFWNI_03095 [Streptomyces sp. NPDC058377]|uniref:hypothetical protein n=1 Tax=Streptomyces sp. NPDC058377 TaxID=3346468 RepID=UPI0036692A84
MASFWPGVSLRARVALNPVTTTGLSGSSSRPEEAQVGQGAEAGGAQLGQQVVAAGGGDVVGAARPGLGELGQLSAQRLQLAPHPDLQPQHLTDLPGRNRTGGLPHGDQDALVLRRCRHRREMGPVQLLRLAERRNIGVGGVQAEPLVTHGVSPHPVVL